MNKNDSSNRTDLDEFSLPTSFSQFIGQLVVLCSYCKSSGKTNQK